MNYANYKTIQIIKKSERAEILFASVEGLEQPVVVKRLTEGNPEIYRAVAALENSHIPRIYAIEEQETELCVVEEYIDGKSLSTYLEEEPLTDVQKLELMVQLCDAVEVLHGCIPPVIHRDIKPSNILINTDGVLKLIDFDASRQYKGEGNRSDTRLLGTIEYAAPEQFGYAQTDFRSDIYSLGVVFSELKIEKGAAFARIWKCIVDKCTSFDPENRYKNVPELKRDLLKCIRKAKSGRRLWITVVAGAAVFALVVAGSLLVNRNRETGALNAELTKPAEVTITPTPEPEETEGVVLLCDNYFWKEETLPVVVKLGQKNQRKVEKIYLCEKTVGEEPFSETIAEVPSELVEISQDGKELRLGSLFFGTYSNPAEVCLYVEFDDGTGERMWLNYGETVPEEVAESSYTEIFTYETTKDNKIILTGMTEGAKKDKRNRKLSIPETLNGMPVVEIAEGAFAWLPLTYVDLPEGLLTIGRGAFYGCNLYTVTIPSTVTYVAPRAFGANHGMAAILTEDGNPHYRSRIGVLYDYGRTVLYQMPANFCQDTFTITEGVKEIGEYAFGNCRNLKQIYCDESAVVLGEDVYWDAQATVKKREELPTDVEEKSYTPSQLNRMDSYYLDYQVHDNRAVTIRYDEIYSEMIYALPDIVDLRYCSEFVIKFKSEVGGLALKLYDGELNEIEVFYPRAAKGIRELTYAPQNSAKIEYVGIMAFDEELMDYSGFVTTVYSLSFRFTAGVETGPVTYKISELEQVQHYNLEYEQGEDGSIHMAFSEIYAAFLFGLPKPVDMSKCSAITIKLKNENALLTIKTLDNNYQEINAYYNYLTDGVQKITIRPNPWSTIYGIAFMTNDKEFTYGETCETTVYSITFHMQK